MLPSQRLFCTCSFWGFLKHFLSDSGWQTNLWINAMFANGNYHVIKASRWDLGVCEKLKPAQNQNFAPSFKKCTKLLRPSWSWKPLLCTGLGQNGLMPFQKCLVRHAWATVSKQGFAKKTTQVWTRWALGQIPVETDGCTLWQQRQKQLSEHLLFPEHLMASWGLGSLGSLSALGVFSVEAMKRKNNAFFFFFISQQSWGLAEALTWKWGLGKKSLMW